MKKILSEFDYKEVIIILLGNFLFHFLFFRTKHLYTPSFEDTMLTFTEILSTPSFWLIFILSSIVLVFCAILVDRWLIKKRLIRHNK